MYYKIFYKINKSVNKLKKWNFSICIGTLMVLRYQQNRLSKTEPCYVIMVSLAKLGLIMIYFYICDRYYINVNKSCVMCNNALLFYFRTNFFMKENKYYSDASFWLPLGYVFVLGLFFTDESRYTKVLHRDQTDEWKGIYSRSYTKNNKEARSKIIRKIKIDSNNSS